MSIELGDLIESLEREISPPGVDLYPDSTEDILLGHLQDAFWEARLFGLLAGFTEADGQVSNLTEDGDELGRELQQLIVLYAGFRITLTQFQNLNTTFRTKAGPVEFETQKSAAQLKGVLDAIKERLGLILRNLSAYGGTTTTVFDAVVERTYSQGVGEVWWVR